jgi:Protein of unknown function (DUF1822)
MRVCGFTTHRQLKNQGTYYEDSRTYCLPREALADNIISLFATLELNLQVEVPSVVSLSEVEATDLLHILGDASVYNPSLQVLLPQSNLQTGHKISSRQPRDKYSLVEQQCQVSKHPTLRSENFATTTKVRALCCDAD